MHVHVPFCLVSCMEEVLPCIASSQICSACVFCSILQCVAVWCSVVQYVAVLYSVVPCVAVCCSVLQCVTECCTVPQSVVRFMEEVSHRWRRYMYMCIYTHVYIYRHKKSVCKNTCVSVFVCILHTHACICNIYLNMYMCM